MGKIGEYVVATHGGAGGNNHDIPVFLESAQRILGAEVVGFGITKDEYPDFLRDLAGKYSVVVMAVGDGTFGLACDALAGIDDVSIGFLPRGSGNAALFSFYEGSALGKSLRYNVPPLRKGLIADCARQIRDGVDKPLDLIVHEGDDRDRRGFMAGVGLDGSVSAAREYLRSKGSGSIMSYIRALGELFEYEPCRAEVTLDGETASVDDFLIAGMSKIPHYGFGLHICPEAVMDDGLLHGRVVTGSRLRELPRVLRSSLGKKGNSQGRRMGVHRFGIKTSEPTKMQMDGDYIGTRNQTEFNFRIDPHAVKVRVAR